MCAVHPLPAKTHLKKDDALLRVLAFIIHGLPGFDVLGPALEIQEQSISGLWEWVGSLGFDQDCTSKKHPKNLRVRKTSYFQKLNFRPQKANFTKPQD